MPSANLMPQLCHTSPSSDVYLPLRMSHLNSSSVCKKVFVHGIVANYTITLGTKMSLMHYRDIKL